MDFHVIGLDRDGRPFDRSLIGESAEAVAASLRAEGCQVSEVRPSPPPALLPAPDPTMPSGLHGSDPAPAVVLPASDLAQPAGLPGSGPAPPSGPSTPAAPPRAPRGRIGLPELVFFCTHLAGVARIGLPLPGALRSLAVETSRKPFRTRVEALAASVESGTSLSAALDADPHGFPLFLRRAVAAGERSGSLGPALLMIAQHLRLTAEIRRKMTEVLVYPVTLVIVLVVILAFHQSISDQIGPMYKDMGVQLPAATQLLLAAGEHAGWIAFLLAAVVATGVSLGKMAIGGARLGPWLDRLFLRLPVYGVLLRTALVARFCHLTSLLLRAEVPAPEALRLVAEALGNRPVGESVIEVARIVEEGGRVTDGARGSGFLPATLVWMLAAGESRGELPATLAEAADLYETTFRHQIAVLENVVGPVIVVLTGVVVLSIMLTVVILPLLRLVQSMS